ncbi:phospholipid carrier-dependent glycosyltransferase [Enterococcus sp. CSURQ0835]|uniref:phospholipid carrier-dependent glycosyltransferase n=1 Tax=Enterococcus sp. CSURQ0835 TaxID=2681394 RepID=UPI001359B453|nr:phospholipid carrier-dependent glycosyltransferase [Enterococcus sp. CSURQ0835]
MTITKQLKRKVKKGTLRVFSDYELAWAKPVALTLLTLIFLIWAKTVPYAQGPDEPMRYLIPKFIYQHGRLPTGYDKGAVYALGNWSYAFYPQLLGGILGAAFIKVGSLFSESKEVLLYFCRLTSVMFGLVAVNYFGKTIERITQKKNYAALGMVLMGLFPQFTFLTSYVNNDIIAVAGTSIIVYALVDGVYSLWNRKNTLTLALGVIVCGLGYMNSYGFILVGGLFFLLSNFWQVHTGRSDWRRFRNLFLWLFIVCAVVILPFFIRNYLLYGDFIGSSVFRKEYLKWVADHGRRLQHPYIKPPYAGDLTQFLTDSMPPNLTKWSFIGFFGNMSVVMDMAYYNFYQNFFLVTLVGVAITLMYQLVRFLKKKIDTPVFEKVWLVIFLFVGVLITSGLFVYYNLYIDFQPQGRYLMANLVPLMLLTFFGVKRLSNLLKVSSNLLFFSVGGVWLIVHIHIYLTYIFNVYLTFKK